MAVTLGDISFDGMNGTLQRPKPVFEKYTRLGSDQIYFQRLKTESIESNIEAWKVFDTKVEALAHERSIKENLGIPLTFTFHEDEPIFGVFIHDYSHTIKVGANDKILVRYSLTLVCDEKSGVEG